MRKIALFSMMLLLAAGTQAGYYTGSGSTHQQWSFDTADTTVLPDDGGEGNPNGAATLEISGSAFDSDLEWVDGVWTGSIVKLNADIPNTRVQEGYKEIYVEIAFQGDLVLSWIKDLDGNEFTLKSSDTAQEGNWTILKEIWYIEPNPLGETLCYGFKALTVDTAMIDYIIVDTICVPEPMTMAFLGLGGLLFLRKRR